MALTKTAITVILMDPVGDGFPFNNNDNALANDQGANGPQLLNGNLQMQFATFGVCKCLVGNV